MTRTLWGITALLFLWACGDGDASDEAQRTDTRTQAASYARADVACKVSSDCCVVYDSCMASALVVSAMDRDTVRDLLDGAPDDKCVGCIPPAVQVDCVDGLCVGSSLPFDEYADFPKGIGDDHCGLLGEPEPMESGGTMFGCGVGE